MPFAVAPAHDREVVPVQSGDLRLSQSFAHNDERGVDQAQIQRLISALELRGADDVSSSRSYRR